MLALVLAAALQAATPDAVPRVNSDPLVVDVTGERCRERARQYVQNLEGGGGLRNLGELPPGVVIHAVLKTVDGCPVNVLMQRGPDGRKLEVPAGAAGIRNAPVSGRSERQRLPQRQR